MTVTRTPLPVKPLKEILIQHMPSSHWVRNNRQRRRRRTQERGKFPTKRLQRNSTFSFVTKAIKHPSHHYQTLIIYHMSANGKIRTWENFRWSNKILGFYMKHDGRVYHDLVDIWPPRWADVLLEHTVQGRRHQSTRIYSHCLLNDETKTFAYTGQGKKQKTDFNF